MEIGRRGKGVGMEGKFLGTRKIMIHDEKYNINTVNLTAIRKVLIDERVSGEEEISDCFPDNDGEDQVHVVGHDDEHEGVCQQSLKSVESSLSETIGGEEAFRESRKLNERCDVNGILGDAVSSAVLRIRD